VLDLKGETVFRTRATFIHERVGREMVMPTARSPSPFRATTWPSMGAGRVVSGRRRLAVGRHRVAAEELRARRAAAVLWWGVTRR
jgi:hypothetical protein